MLILKLLFHHVKALVCQYSVNNTVLIEKHVSVSFFYKLVYWNYQKNFILYHVDI